MDPSKSGSEDAPFQEADLEETFSRSSGPGGQNVNKVATRVTLTHLPTGLSVSVQDARSQAENRSLARERLAKLIRLQKDRERGRLKDAKERERRRRRPRPQWVKRKFVRDKRRRSEVKKNRASGRRPDAD